MKIGVTGIITFFLATLVMVILTTIIPNPRYWIKPIQNVISVNLLTLVFIYSLSAIASILYLRPISRLNCFFVGFYPTIYLILQYCRPEPFLDYNLVKEFIPPILIGYLCSVLTSLKLNRR